jgi:hypothetical protein
MHVPGPTRTTLILLLLALLSAPALQAASPVRLQLTRGQLILIPVMADDQGPFYFLLDTGSDVTIVSTALARKLALTTQQSAHLTTITGTQTVEASRLDKLAIGGVEVEQLPVFEEELSSLRGADSRIAGIIGQDFLSRFNYLLDYHTRSIRFEEGNDVRDEIDGDEVSVETDKNLMILAAKAEFLGHADLHLILDSGANTVVLVGSASNTLHCAADQEDTQISSSGEAIVRLGQVDLTVSSHKFRNLPVTLTISAPPHTAEDGLLPMALFDAIYINNQHSFVVLNPHAKSSTKPAIPGGAQKSLHAYR